MGGYGPVRLRRESAIGPTTMPNKSREPNLSQRVREFQRLESFKTCYGTLGTPLHTGRSLCCTEMSHAGGRALLCLALMPAFLHGGAVPRPAFGAALRCRGGGRDGERPAPAFNNALRSAAQKLCASPPLLALKPAKAVPLQRHMRGIVFGGMDGILTTFALLAAVAGSGGSSPALTLVIGISTVLADGLSMGAGEYLSAKAEAEVAGGTNDEETTPLEKGVAVSRQPPATQHGCVRLLSPPPSPAVRAPAHASCVAWPGQMFVAFTVFGAMPLFGYLLTELLARRAERGEGRGVGYGLG